MKAKRVQDLVVLCAVVISLIANDPVILQKVTVILLYWITTNTDKDLSMTNLK